jgi:hypothetical protein
MQAESLASFERSCWVLPRRRRASLQRRDFRQAEAPASKRQPTDPKVKAARTARAEARKTAQQERSKSGTTEAGSLVA